MQERPHFWGRLEKLRSVCAAKEKEDMSKEYRYRTTSLIGLIQQLACCYAPHGYWFYVAGRVPEGKDPLAIDAKLLAKYGVARSRSSRARRKRAGLANLHYLRHDRVFILLATHGRHPFFQCEANIRDLRRQAFRHGGYAVSYKRGQYRRKQDRSSRGVRDDKYHVRVRIDRERYAELKAWFLDLALRRTPDQLAAMLYNLPFEPYAPVRQQLLNLLRLVNKKRKAAGLASVPPTCIRYRRRIVKPFDPFPE